MYCVYFGIVVSSAHIVAMAQMGTNNIQPSGIKLSGLFQDPVRCWDHQRLLACDSPDCQIIDFGDIPVYPRQSENMMTLKVKGIDINAIDGL
ncbi:hypothetical protein CHS0354_035789 [Potamilus streckersoni]|uniref:Uncharacterized protein n=1 Tax=Potamilus streckersoni TaxID=2493646 RepID=A0AAE0SX61_9BIVA|nr:hypothetical protein CHS0354_035789 [Potamilus streckersoni]